MKPFPCEKDLVTGIWTATDPDTGASSTGGNAAEARKRLEQKVANASNAAAKKKLRVINSKRVLAMYAAGMSAYQVSRTLKENFQKVSDIIDQKRKEDGDSSERHRGFWNHPVPEGCKYDSGRTLPKLTLEPGRD